MYMDTSFIIYILLRSFVRSFVSTLAIYLNFVSFETVKLRMNEGIDHTPYIVDFRSARWLPYDHRSVANTDTCSAPNKQGRACFFFRMAPSLDGERARQLAITLLGAKDGGRHHQERALVLTSLRRQIRCRALFIKPVDLVYTAN